MLKGIDISVYQSATPDLTQYAFVGIRASIGATKDTRYDQHYSNARKAGVIVVAYHYGLDAADVAIDKQVAAFMAAAPNADLWALDQEASGFTDDEAQAFVDGVKAAGLPAVGLYHSSAGFAGVKVDWQWVADWRAAAESAGYPLKGDASGEFAGWDIWQWDGGGADGLDNDYWNPATTVAALLRMGYVTKRSSDAAVAAVENQVASLTSQLAAARTDLMIAQASVAARDTEIARLKGVVGDLQLQLDAAPRLAQIKIAEALAMAEKDRVMAVPIT